MSRLHRGVAFTAVGALSAAALLAAPLAANAETSTAPMIVLNEIVYDDAATGLADQVELFNAGTEAVALDGWRIADEKRDAFGAVPAGTILEPGGFVVLVKDVDFDFGLGKGDEVVLFDASDAEIDSYAYENTAPLAVWARCPDGTGEWAPATAATPGAANDCAIAPVDGSIRINEVDSQPADWVEFYNPGTEALDISGYEIRDNSDDHRWRFPAGSEIGGGEFLVVEEGSMGVVDGTETAFRDPIGIGSADRIRLFDASGALLDDTEPWEGHAEIDGDSTSATLARCPDGVGAFVLAHATPNAANSCVAPDVAINEIESNGDATDWVEVVNRESTAVDLSSWTLMDADPVGHAAETTPLPAGTVLEPGAFFVFDQPRDFVFGLGGGDTVTIRDADGSTVAEHVYADHADGVWARCPDGTGEFVDIAVSTKGAANACGDAGGTPGEEPGDDEVAPWPGSAEVRVLDGIPTFLEDSSGLDVQETSDGVFLWAVDNGDGRIWKLEAQADGSVIKADGWDEGKRVRFQRDASDPDAAGPDTEGITVAGDGSVYVASERDNSAKGVNQNLVLKVDPDAADGDLVAEQEWDLTSLLPSVGANLGIEAVEWISDDVLAGALFDDTTGAAYDPSAHADHGDGLFFVAVEDTGHVYAFAFRADGSATLVSEIAPGLAGVMALDYDSVLDVLWAVCDDGCHGRSAQIALNGTATPDIVRFARPAGMPDINNEGFATAPASLAVDGERPVWWFADGFATEALRVGTLPVADAGEVPGENPGGETPEAPGEPGAENPGAGNPGAENPVAGDPGAAPLPGGAAAEELATTGAELPVAATAFAVVLLAAGALLLRARRGHRV
ncbi:hypothetical protein M2317_001930 [Microbacterium sp. ZKA21]|uniref:lamin tail domain-containing protein n=1 Tax=Microbacterium sp. ZKA21 TaxID=3381694 RepID=UPI003D220FB6